MPTEKTQPSCPGSRDVNWTGKGLRSYRQNAEALCDPCFLYSGANPYSYKWLIMESGLAYLTFCVLRNEDFLYMKFVMMKMKNRI
jgi:hypothetical protein